MTRAQEQLYWRTWAHTSRALGWHHVDTLRARPPYPGAGAAATLAEDVWYVAELRANGAPLTPNHMRHAIHQVVLGYDKSHRDLNNRELDMVLAAMRVLADPVDLRAAMTLQQEAMDHTTRRRLWWIRHRVRPAYRERVMRDFFGHTDLGRLNPRDIATLHAILKQRAYRHEHTPATPSDAALAGSRW